MLLFNSIPRDAITPSAIKAPIESLHQVLTNGENKTKCRRKLLLKHFDEEFQPQACGAQCDNCKDRREFVMRDVTCKGFTENCRVYRESNIPRVRDWYLGRAKPVTESMKLLVVLP